MTTKRTPRATYTVTLAAPHGHIRIAAEIRIEGEGERRPTFASLPEAQRYLEALDVQWTGGTVSAGIAEAFGTEAARMLHDAIRDGKPPASHTCPGCNGTPHRIDERGVATCGGCGGIFTTRPLRAEDLTTYIDPRWADANRDDLRYFDITTEATEEFRANHPGLTTQRYHGWQDKDSRRVHQWG